MASSMLRHHAPIRRSTSVGWIAMRTSGRTMSFLFHFTLKRFLFVIFIFYCSDLLLLLFISFFFYFPMCLRIIAIGHAPRRWASGAHDIPSSGLFAIEQFTSVGVVSMVLLQLFFSVNLFLSALFVKHLGAFLLSGQLSLFVARFFYFDFLFWYFSSSKIICFNRSCFSISWLRKLIMVWIG